MNFIQKRSDWITTSCDEITIGITTVSVSDLENYYTSIHACHSFPSRAARYLCSVGVEEVMRKQVYKNQGEVDKVFFGAVLLSCENFLIEWVNDWKEVYRQLGHSKAPFRKLIITEGFLLLTGKEYKCVSIEIRRIRRFFSILNMPGAVQMMLDFSDSILWYSEKYIRLPDVYPFALKGKPVELLPKAGQPGPLHLHN